DPDVAVVLQRERDRVVERQHVRGGRLRLRPDRRREAQREDHPSRRLANHSSESHHPSFRVMAAAPFTTARARRCRPPARERKSSPAFELPCREAERPSGGDGRAEWLPIATDGENAPRLPLVRGLQSAHALEPRRGETDKVYASRQHASPVTAV